MRRANLPVLMIAFLLVSTSHVLGLLDNFDDGKADGWVEVQGEWKVEKGMYMQDDTEWTTTATNETYHRSFFGDPNWKDYTVQAEVTITEAGDLAPIAGIFFRVTSLDEEGGYYYWRIDQRDSEGPMLIKSPNTIIAENRAIFAEVPTEIGEVALMKAVVKGTHIECWLDGELIFEIDDPDFETGAIGVGTFNAEATFDNVEIEGPGIPASYVDFSGKLATLWGNIKRYSIDQQY